MSCIPRMVVMVFIDTSFTLRSGLMPARPNVEV
jgi:hypothetical protein